MGSTAYQQRTRNLTPSKLTWRQPPAAWLTESPRDALCQAASLPCKHRAGLSSSHFFAFSFALRLASVSPLVGGIRAHVSLLLWPMEYWRTRQKAGPARCMPPGLLPAFVGGRPASPVPQRALHPGQTLPSVQPGSPRPSLQTCGPDIRAYVVVVMSTDTPKSTRHQTPTPVASPGNAVGRECWWLLPSLFQPQGWKWSCPRPDRLKGNRFIYRLVNKQRHSLC